MIATNHNDIDDLAAGLSKLGVSNKNQDTSHKVEIKTEEVKRKPEQPKRELEQVKKEPERKPKKGQVKGDREQTKELKPKKGLTPYQGDMRTFGRFHCEECINDWSSAWSWADTAQKCDVCKKFRFPEIQIPFYMLEFGGRNTKKPHVQQSCGKCIQIKDSCTKLKTCNERPESRMGQPPVGLSEAIQNVKPKPPKRKRNRKSKKN